MPAREARFQPPLLAARPTQFMFLQQVIQTIRNGARGTARHDWRPRSILFSGSGNLVTGPCRWLLLRHGHALPTVRSTPSRNPPRAGGGRPTPCNGFDAQLIADRSHIRSRSMRNVLNAVGSATRVREPSAETRSQSEPCPKRPVVASNRWSQSSPGGQRKSAY